jgi:hypothetical protein
MRIVMPLSFPRPLGERPRLDVGVRGRLTHPFVGARILQRLDWPNLRAADRPGTAGAPCDSVPTHRAKVGSNQR